MYIYRERNISKQKLNHIEASRKQRQQSKISDGSAKLAHSFTSRFLMMNSIRDLDQVKQPLSDFCRFIVCEFSQHFWLRRPLDFPSPKPEALRKQVARPLIVYEFYSTDPTLCLQFKSITHSRRTITQ